MSFSDCQGRPLWVSSTCPRSLQPCWNHSPLTLVVKKKNHPREHCHAILGGFISDFAWGKQPSVNTSSPVLTRRKCSKFNSQSYGFECGTAWVSEFLSFDFTHYKTQGLNLPGRAAEHPGLGLIRCAVSLQFCTLLELGECLVKCHRCNLTHSAFQVPFSFLFFLRKKWDHSRSLFFG